MPSLVPPVDASAVLDHLPEGTDVIVPLANGEPTAVLDAIEAGVTLDVIGNNRAWGNTPDLARTLAHRFLDFAERKGA